MTCPGCGKQKPSGYFFQRLIKSRFGVKDFCKTYWSVIAYKCKDCGEEWVDEEELSC
jgi:formate dehydrogenase maturation protein FdhE